MLEYKKELTPVQYKKTAIKVINFKVEAGHGCFRTHWHDRMEILRIHSGEMYVGFGTNITKLTAGQMMILPPKRPHKGFTTDSDVDYDVLMFDVRSFYNETEICKTYLPAIYDGRARFAQVISDKDTVDCFDNIFAGAERDFLDTTSNIYRFLYLLYDRSLLELRQEISHDNTVIEMITYIEDHFAEELSTATLCEHFGYTSAHFCRKYKEATGLTPMNYLRIYRMEEAYKMLKNGERNINEIAEKCGFSDANYFTRCFKEHFGKAPTRMLHEKIEV